MRIYAYGAKAPLENTELVRQQLWLATIYQRTLVLIERKRRQIVDRCYQQKCPKEWAEHEAAAANTAAMIDIVKQQRARPGDMLEPDEEMKREAREQAKIAKENLAAAREREVAAWAAWKEARRRVAPGLKKRLDMCKRGAQARNKFAYNRGADIDLAWGTRLKTGEAVEVAAKATAQLGTMPHIPRFDGRGMVAVQLQGASGIDDKKGLSIADAMSGDDTRLQIKVVGPEEYRRLQGRDPFLYHNGKPKQPADPNGKRSKERAAATGGSIYAIARLRLSSDGRKPIWATWPVVLHRGVPTNAPIKWAIMYTYKIGPRTEWQLLLCVDEELPTLKSQGPVLAINHGWRNLPDGGLRVAYAVGSDGHREEVRVPPEYVTGIAHVDSLKSIRDKLHEDAKKLLSDWRHEGERPEWFIEESRYVAQWKSQKKLARFVHTWRSHRFEGDTKTFEIFDAWLKKDLHLWRWESDEREKLWSMRQNYYRNIAARWAERYPKILVTAMDLRDFAELPKPEDAADTEGNEQRRSRFLAAPSVFVSSVENGCSTRGTAFGKVDGKFMTQTCHACGVTMAFPAKTFLVNTCSACGATWDQDENHGINLMTKNPPIEEKKKRPNRWSKRKKKNGGVEEQAATG